MTKITEEQELNSLKIQLSKVKKELADEKNKLLTAMQTIESRDECIKKIMNERWSTRDESSKYRGIKLSPDVLVDNLGFVSTHPYEGLGYVSTSPSDLYRKDGILIKDCGSGFSVYHTRFDSDVRTVGQLQDRYRELTGEHLPYTEKEKNLHTDKLSHCILIENLGFEFTPNSYHRDGIIVGTRKDERYVYNYGMNKGAIVATVGELQSKYFESKGEKLIYKEKE